jgi:hypothetical protein
MGILKVGLKAEKVSDIYTYVWWPDAKSDKV